MFRVRKLNRRSVVPDARARGKRPRLRDFQEAWRGMRKRSSRIPAPASLAMREYNRLTGAPRGALARIDEVRKHQTGLLVVPISSRGVFPSMAEVGRLSTAIRLREFLIARGLAPCTIALWPGLVDGYDSSPRYVLTRSGQVFAEATDVGDPDQLADDLPETEFTGTIRETLNDCWDSSDHELIKMRLIFSYVLRSDAIALPNLWGFAAEGIPNSVGLIESLEALASDLPMTALVHPSLGKAGEAVAEQLGSNENTFVYFPSSNATLIEHKVERWLEKFELSPEDLMVPALNVPATLDQLFPGDPSSVIGERREQLLSRLFHLEHQLQVAGFENDRVLDKLANQLDGQFDRLRSHARKVREREIETAANQLEKARAYLRPEGWLQSEAMSLLHYLNFYGPDFCVSLASSIELGDSRHHLMYLGN